MDTKLLYETIECNELLPCPLCNKTKDEIHLAGNHIDSWMYIHCTNCGLQLTSKRYIPERTDLNKRNQIMNDLIKRWNTRKFLDKVAEDIENELTVATAKSPINTDYNLGLYKALEIMQKDAKQNNI